MRFERRAQVIIACARLHNFCINKRIKDDLCEKSGLTEIQPDRWALTPMFDKEGRPVEYLKTGSKKATRIAVATSAAAAKTDRGLTRKRLIDAIDEAGLVRPLVGNKRRRFKAGGR